MCSSRSRPVRRSALSITERLSQRGRELPTPRSGGITSLTRTVSLPPRRGNRVRAGSPHATIPVTGCETRASRPPVTRATATTLTGGWSRSRNPLDTIGRERAAAAEWTKAAPSPARGPRTSSWLPRQDFARSRLTTRPSGRTAPWERACRAWSASTTGSPPLLSHVLYELGPSTCGGPPRQGGDRDCRWAAGRTPRGGQSQPVPRGR